jgi:hypothetical protein
MYNIYMYYILYVQTEATICMVPFWYTVYRVHRQYVSTVRAADIAVELEPQLYHW